MKRAGERHSAVLRATVDHQHGAKGGQRLGSMCIPETDNGTKGYFPSWLFPDKTGVLKQSEVAFSQKVPKSMSKSATLITKLTIWSFTGMVKIYYPKYSLKAILLTSSIQSKR